MKRKTRDTMAVAKAAILALAEVKAAAEAFDRGETNAFDALEAIADAVDAYRAADRTRQDAA